MKTPNESICLASSAALPRVPEASGVVPGVDSTRVGAGALAPACGVSEGTESARRINKTIPLKSCAPSGCNYPEGGCLGVCS